MKTDYLNTFGSKMGLDMIDFCKNFSSHIDSSKEEKDQYHKPFKELPVDIHVADPILLKFFMKNPPFPTRMRGALFCDRHNK